MHRLLLNLNFDLKKYSNILMRRAKYIKIILISCLFFALCLKNVSGALPEERPGAFAMVIDVPIRVIGIGLTTIGTAFFIIALPFAMSSGSTGDAWDALVIEPFQFTFTRPLGNFEEWKRSNEISDPSKTKKPLKKER